MRINGCQETPWSEELDRKELHGAAGGEYDREPRRSTLSCTRSPHNPSRHQRYGIMLVLKGVVFLHDRLYSFTLEEYLISSFCVLVNCVASLNSAHSFVIHSECSFRECCLRELKHRPRYSKRVLDLGRVSLKTARSLVYYSSQI